MRSLLFLPSLVGVTLEMALGCSGGLVVGSETSGEGGMSAESSSGTAGGSAPGGSASGGPDGAGSTGAKSGARDVSDATLADTDACGSNIDASSFAYGSGHQGVVVAPASDLPAPAAADGVQIATPTHDPNDPNASQLIVAPYQEREFCYYATVSKTADIHVGAYQSWASGPGALYLTLFARTTTGSSEADAVPDGTVSDCSRNTAPGVSLKVLYDGSVPGAVESIYLPPGVAQTLAAGTQLSLLARFVNPTCAPLMPHVKVNLLYAQNVQYQVGLAIAFNAGVDIPPANAGAPGRQSVKGTCNVPAGSKFFLATMRTYEHVTSTSMSFVTASAATEIAHTGAEPRYPADQEPGSGTEWRNPGVGVWTAPNFPTVNAGDSFTYSCSYANSGNTQITVGETSAQDECEALLYYYPAGSASCD